MFQLHNLVTWLRYSLSKKPGLSRRSISLKNIFLKTEKWEKYFYVSSHLLYDSRWVVKCVLQESLELPYITWTEKPENTTRWSFKPKTWLGKSEGFQGRQQSTSPWQMSTTIPHGFLRVCTCFFSFEFITSHLSKAKWTTWIHNVMLLSYSLLTWNILYLSCMASLL